MKFSQLALGKAAENPFSFPMLGEAGTPIEVACLVRPLDGTEEAVAIEFADGYAAARGVKEAREGNALWDLGYMVKVIAIGCLDPDSPEKAREPLFDRGTEQVLSLPRETIAFIFEGQQLWQDRVSPTQKKIAGFELIAKVREIAEAENELPFLRLSPALRWTCMRSMASLLLNAPEDKSQDSSPSDRSGQTWKAQQSTPESTASESGATKGSPTSEGGDVG